MPVLACSPTTPARQAAPHRTLEWAPCLCGALPPLSAGNLLVGTTWTHQLMTRRRWVPLGRGGITRPVLPAIDAKLPSQAHRRDPRNPVLTTTGWKTIPPPALVACTCTTPPLRLAAVAVPVAASAATAAPATWKLPQPWPRSRGTRLGSRQTAATAPCFPRRGPCCVQGPTPRHGVAGGWWVARLASYWAAPHAWCRSRSLACPAISVQDPGS